MDKLVIRESRVEDAETYLELCKQLDAESDFLLYEEGERETNIVEQKKSIENIIETDNSTILVAEDKKGLIGYLLARGGNARRNKHNLYIALAVKKEYTGKGIGTSLMDQLEKWARERAIKRIELGLMAKNIPALILYKKRGFTLEGVKKSMFYVNGEYIDEYIMAKIL